MLVDVSLICLISRSDWSQEAIEIELPYARDSSDIKVLREFSEDWQRM